MNDRFITFFLEMKQKTYEERQDLWEKVGCILT